MNVMKYEIMLSNCCKNETPVTATGCTIEVHVVEDYCYGQLHVTHRNWLIAF